MFNVLYSGSFLILAEDSWGHARENISKDVIIHLSLDSCVVQYDSVTFKPWNGKSLFCFAGFLVSGTENHDLTQININ